MALHLNSNFIFHNFISHNCDCFLDFLDCFLDFISQNCDLRLKIVTLFLITVT